MQEDDLDPNTSSNADDRQATDDEIEVPPYLYWLEWLNEEIQRFKTLALADLELEIRGLEVNRKPQAAFFRKNFAERVDTYSALGRRIKENLPLDQVWILFDELQWTLAYDRQQSPGGFDVADPKPLPPSWKPCVALNLYNALLRERCHLERSLRKDESRVRQHPDINKRQLLHPADLIELREELKITQSHMCTFFQVMDNMELEVAAARNRDGAQAHGKDAPQDPICKVLKEEINKKYPVLEIPNVGASLTPKDDEGDDSIESG
ncbi:hypothetical protein H2200_005852 [Cladophialophora chaetospira]|uniref:Uncharacterized protein n=1 Tax=Cladophialophora chaetospira TaxID=386627 RepID=A0AA39CIP8_9EURO|nr:hypothetical protein H2200_005852 [Cladophialophora chaetospira]